MNKIRLFLFFILVLLSTAHSQEKKIAGKGTPTIDMFKKWDSSTARIDSAVKADIDKAVMGQAGKRGQEVADLQMVYYRFSIEHQIKVLRWQFYSSILIFFSVILIVLTGLYLSYRQFELAVPGMKRAARKKAVEQAGTEEIQLAQTKLEISKDSIKIDTAVIGLVILVISVAFFFLYLEFVFPVSILK